LVVDGIRLAVVVEVEVEAEVEAEVQDEWSNCAVALLCWLSDAGQSCWFEERDMEEARQGRSRGPMAETGD
jgi:hypothetical protein